MHNYVEVYSNQPLQKLKEPIYDQNNFDCVPQYDSINIVGTITRALMK